MAPLSWQSDRANFMNGLERGQDHDCFIEEQVRTDRLHQLFRQSFAAIFGSYLAAVMLCWLCWDYIEHNVALSWIGVLSVAMTLAGVDLQSSLFGIWSSLGNIGYGIGPMVAPTGTFVDFPEGAKWVLILTMILGRLSLLALLVVVMPQFWRR